MFFILAFLRRKAVSEAARQTAPGGPADGRAAVVQAAAASATEREGLEAVDLAMHRYADGDDTAFSEIFTVLAPRLRMFLRRLGSAPDLAEDLTQETFLRIHHARGAFAPGKQVAPWAYCIARNCFISHARSGKSKLARASVDTEQLELASGAGAEEESMARQSAEVVSRALAAMTPARREAFVLLRFEGMSVAAAAQIVGISEGALKIRAFHAYEILRAALAGMEKQPAPTTDSGNQLAAET